MNYLSEEEWFKRWLQSSKYYQVTRGLSVEEQQLAWDAWQARSELPTTGAQVMDEMVRVALTAFLNAPKGDDSAFIAMRAALEAALAQRKAE